LVNKKELNFKWIISFFIIFFIAFEIVINFEFLSQNVFWVRTKISYPYYEFILGLLAYLGITSILLFFKNKPITIIWVIKGFVTLFVMIVYEAYYGLDAYGYANYAITMQDISTFGSSGTANVRVFNHFFTYIVGDSYYSLKVFNSFIGFLGLIFLYKSYEYIMIKNNLKIDNKFIYIFFLFPSILFWSSILGKDPLNLFFTGMFTYAFIHIIDKFKFRYLVMIILSIWLVSYIRTWYSIIMVASMFFYFLKLNSIRNFMLFLILLPIFAILVQQLLQAEGISSFETLYLKMTETTQKLAYGQSAVSTNTITGFSDYLLYYIPNLFTTLFRPMPWDIRNPFTLMAAVENVILLYLAYKYIFKSWKEIYSNKYLKFLILFIFSWSLLYVIISPANLGGAARFKLQVLPAMIILIGVAIALNRQKFNQSKPRTTKNVRKF